MTDLIEHIDKFLQQADECEMLGGLAATHDERVRYRERAKRLRCLASEARGAREMADRMMRGSRRTRAYAKRNES
jgi:hypothetical protein